MTEATEHALLNAARAVHALADDLRGNENSGTLGTFARITLRAIINAATSIEALADDLRGNTDDGTIGYNLRAMIKRIGSKS